MIFELAHTDWETYTPYLFQGPDSMTPDAWRGFCKLATDRAAEVITAQGRLRCDGVRVPVEVSWSAIVEEAAGLLESEHGFRRVNPVQVHYSGDKPDAEDAGDLSPDVLEKVKKFNREKAAAFRAEWEAELAAERAAKAE